MLPLISLVFCVAREPNNSSDSRTTPAPFFLGSVSINPLCRIRWTPSLGVATEERASQTQKTVWEEVRNGITARIGSLLGFLDRAFSSNSY